jgi:iron-sulfur cluster repair protein YtfE (RIC family)
MLQFISGAESNNLHGQKTGRLLRPQGDALNFLNRDHENIRQLFRTYEQSVNYADLPARKSEIAGQICFEWCIHIQIEEEIFYPAIQGISDLVHHAIRDHQGSRELVAMIDEMEPGDAEFDAAVSVLAAYVIPHLTEEEEMIFPKVRAAGLNTLVMGQQLARRYKDLHYNVAPEDLKQSASRSTNWPPACRLIVG